MDRTTLAIVSIPTLMALLALVLNRYERRQYDRHMRQAIDLANSHHPSRQGPGQPIGPEDEADWITWKEGR